MKKHVQITKTESSVVIVYDNRQIIITDNSCNETHIVTQYIASSINTSELSQTVKLATC